MICVKLVCWCYIRRFGKYIPTDKLSNLLYTLSVLNMAGFDKSGYKLARRYVSWKYLYRDLVYHLLLSDAMRLLPASGELRLCGARAICCNCRVPEI